MTDLAKMVVHLEAETARYQRELDKANKKLNRFASAQTKSLDGIKTGFKVMGVAAAAAAGGLTLIYNKQSQVIDATAKLSDRLGVSIGALQGYRHAAELGGVGSEKFDKSVSKMVKNLGDARNGLGTAKTVLEEYGLVNEEFFALNTEQQFEAIGKKISELESPAEKASLATAVFGRAGQDLINTFESGTFAQAAADVEAVGAAMSRVDAAKVEAANDAMTRVGLVTQGLGQQFTAQVAPFVDAFADSLFNAAKEAGGMGNVVKTAMQNIVTGVGYAANALHGMEIAWQAVLAAANTAIAGSVGALAALDEGITSFLNKIPGVSAETNDFLQTFAESSAAVAVQARKNLQETMAQPWPKEQVIQWAEEVTQEATLAAQEVAAATAAEAAEAGTGAKGSPEELEKVVQYLMSEEEQLQESFLRRKDIILANTEETSLLRTELTEKLEQDHQNRMLKIQAKSAKSQNKIVQQWQKADTKSWKGRTKFALGALGQLTSGFSSESRALFAVSKAANMGLAIMNVATGVTEALKLPYPANIAAAAHVAATGAIEIGTIAGASFGGGGGRSGGGGGGGGGAGFSAADFEQQITEFLNNRGGFEEDAPEREVNIFVDGNPDPNYTRNFVEALNEAGADGVHYNVSVA